MGEAAAGRHGGADPRRGRGGAGPSVLTPPRGLPILPDLRATAVERADLMRLIPPTPPDLYNVVDPCVCGHSKAVHDHYRPGWDCGVCGAVLCVDFRAQDGEGGARRVLRWLGLVT